MFFLLNNLWNLCCGRKCLFIKFGKYLPTSAFTFLTNGGMNQRTFAVYSLGFRIYFFGILIKDDIFPFILLFAKSVRDTLKTFSPDDKLFKRVSNESGSSLIMDGWGFDSLCMFDFLCIGKI